MTVVAVVSTKGSPGATTLAATIAARQTMDGGDALLIEADPAGGTLALDTQLGLDPGLLTLAAAARRGIDPDLIERHSQRLGNDVRVLLAPTSPERAAGAVAALAAGMAGVLSMATGLVVLDCGRWWPGSSAAPLVGAADVVLLATHPTAQGAEHARTRLDGLNAIARRVEVVCVGERPYPSAEVASVLDFASVRSVAMDRRSAELVRAGVPPTRWLRRAPLLRSVAELHQHLVGAVTAEVPA